MILNLLPGLAILSPVVSAATVPGHNELLRGLLLILCILFMLAVLSIVITIIRPFRQKSTTVAAIAVYAATGIVLIASICGFLIYRSSLPKNAPPSAAVVSTSVNSEI